MDNLLSHFQQQFNRARPDLLDVCDAQRQRAMDCLLDMGFPHRKVEDWKYVDFSSFNTQRFQWSLATAEPEPMQHNEHAYHIDIIDGVCRIPATLKAVIQVAPLADAMRDQDTLARLAKPIRHAFDALNQAFMQHGLVIDIAENTQLDKPIVINHVQRQSEFIPTTHLIRVHPQASVCIMERFYGSQPSYFVNSQTLLELLANAHCEHHKVITECTASYHIGDTRVHQARDSQLVSYVHALSGQLVRSDTHVTLAEPGASAKLFGVSLASQKQCFDHHTEIRHAAAHTHSEEYYKTIARDQARIVFNGKVRVEPDAQQVVSAQQNKNLLLSPHAEIDSKPELEIFADDVKCSHGSTIGELDQDALFYLKSRGITAVLASQMLLQAFIDEILCKVTSSVMSDQLQSDYDQALVMMENNTW